MAFRTSLCAPQRPRLTGAPRHFKPHIVYALAGTYNAANDKQRPFS